MDQKTAFEKWLSESEYRNADDDQKKIAYAAFCYAASWGISQWIKAFPDTAKPSNFPPKT